MSTSWIDLVMDMTMETESPRQWIWWSALCSIAAVAGSNTFLDHQYYKLSPNMFVMLLGRSGLGKGFPIWLAKELVERADVTRVISGRNSIEAVVKELGTISSRPGRPPIPDSRGFLVSGEFRNFILKNPDALTILTELYDTHYSSKWKNTLKNAGIDSLKGVCLTLLGASSPAHYREAVTESDLEGGYAARTLHIYEEEMGRINALVRPLKTPFIIEELVKGLTEIASVHGEFKYAPGADTYFEDWYNDFRGKQIDAAKKGVYDDSGLDQRLHNHIDKVAMCLSLASRADLRLTNDDFDQAIKVCQGLIIGVRKANIGPSKEEITKMTQLVIHQLLHTPEYEMPKSKLLQRLWNKGLNVMNLAVIQETLQDARIARVYKADEDLVFQLENDYVKEVEEHNSKKKKKKDKPEEPKG